MHPFGHAFLRLDAWLASAFALVELAGDGMPISGYFDAETVPCIAQPGNDH